MWFDIQSISETQSGRQALSTTGAVITAAYLGHIGPELFTTMHEALCFYASKYPFLDSADMASSLWDGAKYFSASVVDYASSIIEDLGFDMSHTIRESVNVCRDYISRSGQRGLEAARETLQETATFIGGHASVVVTHLQEAAEAGYKFVKEHLGPIAGIFAAAHQAYEYFQTGESLYDRLFKRGKKEIQGAGTSTEEEANLSVNTAIAGREALQNADAIMRREAVAKRIQVDPEQILWVSEELYSRLEEEGVALSRLMDASPKENPKDTHSTKLHEIHGLDGEDSIHVPSSVSNRLTQSPDFDMSADKLSSIGLVTQKKTASFGKQWSESPESRRRIEALRTELRKTAQTGLDLADPMAFEKGSHAVNDEMFELPTFLGEPANDDFYKGPEGDDGPGLM